MSVFLQFDSSARTNPYINIDGLWYPNDNYENPSGQPIDDSFIPYQQNKDLVQSTTNYKVFYKELNDTNNTRTIGFLAHCKERPVNLTFSVESCTVTLPANALVPRLDDAGNLTYVSVLDEPYIYVRMMPIENSEGNLIYSNNPPADEATFILWLDRIQVSNTANLPFNRPPNTFEITDFNQARWLLYKTCMITVMRLNLATQEWQIRIYDRFGNDILAPEADAGGAGYDTPPAVNPDLQTMLLVGIKPNYAL